jgi:DNA-binding MarR family transcriptional regulator
MMDTTIARSERIAAIDRIMRQLTWRRHKHSLHALNQPDIALTMPQMITMFAIQAAGTCRMSELAEATQQSAGTLTGIVDRLIIDGLAARVRDADDRRVVQVALTPAGEERLARVEQARCKDMALMLQHFSAEQLEQIEALLHLLLAGISELNHAENGQQPDAAKQNTAPSLS